MKTIKEYILNLEERLTKMEVAYNEMINIVKDTNLKVTDLKNMEFGNWKIQDNKMYFYDLDGNELAVYELYNDRGVGSMTNVFERRLKE